MTPWPLRPHRAIRNWTRQARGLVKSLDADNELRFLRVRSRKHEIMVAPDFDKNSEYYLVVVQEPAAE